jgi:quercetin dioxygenase-like cupin family protein
MQLDDDAKVEEFVDVCTRRIAEEANVSMRFAPILLLVGTVVIGPAAMQAVDAQQTFKRTELQKTDLAGVEGREGVMIQGEFPPGAEAGRHTHPGTELGYLIEGTLTLEVEGGSPATLHAGDSWTVAAGKVHSAKNMGDSPAKTIVVYVVEKGKPLASPAS